MKRATRTSTSIRRLRVLAVLAAWLGICVAARADFVEETADLTEYPTEQIAGSPNAVALGPDGNLWISFLGRIVRMNTDGDMLSFLRPPTVGDPLFLAPGPDGKLWFPEYDEGKLGRISTEGVFDELPLLSSTDRVFSTSLTAGDDGNLWFITLPSGQVEDQKIGRMTPSGIESEFAVQSGEFLSTLARGPDGNIWFAGDAVGHITPAGAIQQFPLLHGAIHLVAGDDGKFWYVSGFYPIGRISTDGQSNVISDVIGIAPSSIALGPDGNLWFAGFLFSNPPGAPLDNMDRVWRLTPNGNLTEFGGFKPDSFLVDITAGPDGSLWVADYAKRIDKIPALKFDFRNLSAGSAPEGIARGADGSVWFTAPGRHLIGRIDALGGTVQLPLPETYHPLGIAVAADGNAWFTDPERNSVTRITPGGDLHELIADTEASAPQDITSSPSGEIWFTEFDGSQIARISADGNSIEEFPTKTPSSNPQGIVALGDGSVWFTERGANRIGRRSAAGEIVDFPIPTDGSGPYDIAAGADGNLWFTQVNIGKIARITPSGDVEEFGHLAPLTHPQYIAAGPDGALWFTDTGSSRLGRITTRGRVSSFVLPGANGAPAGLSDGPGGNLLFALSVSNQIATTHLVAADPPSPTCWGDCTADGIVSGSDVVFGVAIALGELSTDFCPSLRRYGIGLIAVDALVRAVGESRGECGA